MSVIVDAIIIVFLSCFYRNFRDKCCHGGVKDGKSLVFNKEPFKLLSLNNKTKRLCCKGMYDLVLNFTTIDRDLSGVLA